MSESGNKDWMYADDWLKDIYIGQAIAALAVCRPIIEAPLRAENEKLQAALNCFMAMETPTQYRYSRERAEMLANDILRAAAAALKETDNG